MKKMLVILALGVLVLACGHPKQAPVAATSTPEDTTPENTETSTDRPSTEQPAEMPPDQEPAAVQPVTACAESTHYLDTFRTLYGCLNIGRCTLCHVLHQRAGTGGSGFYNQYGEDIKETVLGGAQGADAFKNIEALDSDGDGYSNLAEITGGTHPSSAQSHP